MPYDWRMPDPLPARFKKLLATPEPAELGPGPRPGVWEEAKLDAELETVLREGGLPNTARELVRALVLLWHDHLDASHQISQKIDSTDGSLVHAIMHRREPDFWNSKYWWRRVGKHPCFPELARRVTDLLRSKGAPDLLSQLVPGGEWDPFAFVEACQAATARLPSDERVQLLREIQKVETEAALEHFLDGGRT